MRTHLLPLAGFINRQTTPDASPNHPLKCITTLCLLVLSFSFSVAQPALVKDINTNQLIQGLNPRWLTEMNGIVYFSGYNATNGEELWRTDGTPAGTYIIKDIKPGAEGSSPALFTNVDGTLYFAANQYTEEVSNYLHWTGGYELWKTDGTLAGTQLVEKISFGTWDVEEGNRNQIRLLKVGNALFYTSYSDTNYYGLTSTKGAHIGVSTYPYDEEFLIVNNTLFFSEGTSLWKSDGVTVSLVKAFEHMYAYEPIGLQNINDILYFSADDGIHGREPWKSDGTEAGTVMIKDINPGRRNSTYYPNFVEVNGTFYFKADNGVNGEELWKTDGTEAGTMMVKDIYPGIYGSSLYGGFTSLNGSLYFSAYSDTYGHELWKSDGTAAGTKIVKDIYPGNNGSSPGNLFLSNGILYFSANDGTYGREFWKTNGTTEGTVLVKDLEAGIGDSNPVPFKNVDGTLYVCTYTKYYSEINKLWKSDGTARGTIEIPVSSPTGKNSLSSFLQVNNSLYFVNTGFLWKSSNGTATSIGTPPNISTASSNPQYLTNVNNTLFFAAGHRNAINPSWARDMELWKSNGTEAGTVLVKDINSGPNASNPKYLTPVNGIIYFTANDGIHGEELWKSDGTEAGTLMVKDIYPGVNSSIPQQLTAVNGTLYFIANNGTNGYELWKSDGTAAGTVMVKEIVPGSNSEYYIRSLTAVNGTLYFSANDGTNGDELWKSDGTAAGTILVKNIRPGIIGSYIQYLTNANGTLYFTANDGAHGEELWKSDGTEQGTIMVKDISQQIYSISPKSLIYVNSTLYFSADDGINGSRLWKSDGTAAGTVIAQPSVPGCVDIERITYSNGMFFFFDRTYLNEYDQSSADLWVSDGLPNGRATKLKEKISVGWTLPSLKSVNNKIYTLLNGELWTSDGTVAGTNLIYGAKYVYTSNGFWLENINSTLYFNVYDNKLGEELWKYETDKCIPVSKPGVTVLSGSVCIGSDGKINIKGSETGLSYQAYINNAVIGNPVKGGGDITLTIPAVSLSVGNNIFTIKASGCTITELNTKATISVLNCPTLSCSNSTQSSLVVNPSSGGTLSGTTLYLKTIPGATSYTLQMSTSSDFTTGLITKTTASRLSTGTYYAVFPELSLNQKYYVRVYTNLGLCWGPVTSFTTASAAGSAYVTSPSDGGTTTSTSLYLNTVPGASSYTLQVSTSSDFTTGLLTKTTASRLSTGTYYAVFPELALNQKYYVRVKTNLSDVWGRTTSFTTASAAGSAYVTSPSDGGTTTGTSLYLNTVPGATSYTLHVSTSADFTTGLITRTTASRLSTGTYYAVFPELSLNQKYYVRVKTNLSDIWGRTTSFTRVSAIARLAADEQSAAESLPASLSLYPNPFETTLTLSTTRTGTIYITVVDNLGRIVYQNTAQASGTETTFDLAHLKAGVYIVKVSTEDGKTQVIRVVKK